MDSGIAITALVVILLCIIPLVMLGMNSKKHKKALLAKLHETAGASGSTISRFEQWNNSVLGIDDIKKTVTYVSSIDANITARHLLLEEVQKCQIANVNRTNKSSEGTAQVTERLELILTPVNKSKPLFIIEFYNKETDGLTIHDENHLVEKWNQIINEKIR